MKKLQDWNILFDEFLTKNKDKSFEWGKWDCCLFSDAGIKAMTGESLIPKTLRWKDEKTALEAITSYGKNLKGAIKKAADLKKLEKVKPNFMQKGDLVVYKQESYLCGLCDGYKIITPSDNGLMSNQEQNIVDVWRVPNG